VFAKRGVRACGFSLSSCCFSLFNINSSRALCPILPYLKGLWFCLAMKKSKKRGEMGKKKREY
jgi:hypothetical protein